MKGNDREPTARLQCALRGGERFSDLLQFFIHQQSQRLKAARRRIDFVRPPAHHAADDVGEFAGALDRRFRAFLHDRPRHRPRPPFFAKRREHTRKIGFRPFIDDIGGTRPVAAHAHVERPVAAKGKAALRLVDLHGRNAEIEQHAVERGKAVIARRFVEIGEALLYEHEPALHLGHKIGAESDSGLVSIQSDDTAIRGFEDRARMPARAERAVEIDAAIFGR
jgi:hypothetical protein